MCKMRYFCFTLDFYPHFLLLIYSMKLSTKNEILSALVRASGLVLNETSSEVREKLNGITAKSRLEMFKKLAIAFELPEYAIDKAIIKYKF